MSRRCLRKREVGDRSMIVHRAPVTTMETICSAASTKYNFCMDSLDLLSAARGAPLLAVWRPLVTCTQGGEARQPARSKWEIVEVPDGCCMQGRAPHAGAG